MSRHLVRLAVLSLVFAVSSCDDDVEAPNVSPVEPLPVVSPAAALLRAEVKIKGSTVCAAYERERTKLLEQLGAAPEDKEVLKRASAVAAVITDACN